MSYRLKRCSCGTPLTARPTNVIPAARAMSTAMVDGTEGVAIAAIRARAALYASSPEMRPVTSKTNPAGER